MLERLTRPRISDWVAPLALCALLALLYAGGASLTQSLRYERASVLDGQWWRLVSGNWVHADARHLGWNVCGVLLVWWLFASAYRLREWTLVMVGSTVAIAVGFLVFEPALAWYVGFSGVLHGTMAAGLCAWLRTSRDPLTACVAVLFAAKLGWEHVHGALPFTSATLSVPVVHQAHTYGAIGGLLVALLLARRRQTAAASL